MNERDISLLRTGSKTNQSKIIAEVITVRSKKYRLFGWLLRTGGRSIRLVDEEKYGYDLYKLSKDGIVTKITGACDWDNVKSLYRIRRKTHINLDNGPELYAGSISFIEPENLGKLTDVEDVVGDRKFYHKYDALRLFPRRIFIDEDVNIHRESLKKRVSLLCNKRKDS